MREGMKDCIMDQMVEMLTKYSKNLEETVKKRTNQLEEEKRKLDNLIHQMLPVSVAKQLIQEECNSFCGHSLYYTLQN